MTTDLRYTLQLVDAIPDMKLVADLSHFVVGEEFAWPAGEADEAMIQRILARTWGFHGRVASREQVQIPLGFPQNEQWLDLFLRWWGDGFTAWREQATAEEELGSSPSSARRATRSPAPTVRSCPIAGTRRCF